MLVTKRDQEARELNEAIEENSKAILQFLAPCGPDREFGVKEVRELEKLFRYRRRFILRRNRLRQQAVK